jgi:ribosomal protein S18 acetylase RimI-like enzyme
MRHPGQIRQYEPTDEAAVVQLWKDCGLVVPWNDPHRDVRRKQSVQPELFLVCEVSGEIVASVMAGYDGHRGWLHYVGVHPSSRRLGIGRALLDEVEIRLRAMGCPKINLQVRTENREAMAFYRAVGYVEDEVLSFGRRLIPDQLD